MNRSRYWVHLSFWLLLFLTLALIVLQAQTAGGIMDSNGDVRHFIAMGACLFPLASIVAMRAYDAGAPAGVSLLAIPAVIALFPFSLLVLGLVLTSDRRRSREATALWWMLPAAGAGIGVAYLLSLVLR